MAIAVDESVVMDNTLRTEKEISGGNTPEALAWLRDEGMGLFIHWSIDVQLGCVISHSLVGASEDYIRQYYEELPQMFNPTELDFDYLAGLAKLAGFRYAVFTTKHHNGFCMWDTDSTELNIMNTPYGKDLLAQYVEAFRKQGIKVGFYFSPEDFHFLHQNKLLVTRTPVEPYSQEVMREYRALLEKQMRELLSNYGKIDVMFFDGGERMVDENGESIQKMCVRLAWELQPGILVTRGAIPTPEQCLPGVGSKEVWESCITLGTAWQYQPTNETYRPASEVIRLLVEARAKGGSLLLNIGPDARGGLNREQEGILRELGMWHFINREALHHVEPWILTNEEATWLLKSNREDTVYAVIMDGKDWDRGIRRELQIQSVRATEKTEITVLGQSGECTEYRPDLDAGTYWEQREDGLHISAMNAQRIYCGIQWKNPLVLKITHAEEAFEPMRLRTLSDELEQNAEYVTMAAEAVSLGSFDEANLAFEYRVYPGFAFAAKEGGWQRTKGQKITETGTYVEKIQGLEKGVIYQYRAVIGNRKSTVRGENYQFTRG